MKKRLISLGVCLCILASLCSGYFSTTSASATTENNVNKNLLEAMLNNRSWVIDTLINDDYSTNPHAMVNDMANEKSMMATVLSQYGNKNDPNYSAAYKAVVDALYAWHHAGDYAKDVADYATEWTADIFEFFGGSDNAVSALRRCADSSKTMQYDNILQEVLKSDYTSSSGQTLKGSNSQLVQLRKIQDGVGMLKSFASASKNLSGLDDGMAHTAASYADTVLFPAADAYQDVMNNVAKLTGSDMGENEQALLDLTTALGTVAVYDSIVVSENNSGGAITIAPAYLLDEDTKKIIDINADAAKFADITIDSFMYVSSIQTQKESVAGVLDRTSEHLANAQTRDLLDRYSDLIKDAADGKTSNYDLILTSIRNSGYIEKYAESKISDALKKLRNRFIPCYDQSIVPGAIASATGVVGTATYLADAVTGLEDTSTKTVELKNLNQLIAFFKATFERDFANYKANPTDENAAKVIDDLDFVQRLRLRGETIAYKMSANQLGKPLGKLLSGGSDETLKDFYSYDYQRHIDAILGASIVPYTTDSITVGNGQTLSVYYDPNYGGLYAKYDKGSGNLFNFYGIAELSYRTANGINVSSGGKVLTMSDNASAYMPYIINNGGSVLLAGNMKLSELTQNSGTTQLGANTYQIDNLYLSGGSVQTANGGTINSKNLNISGTVTSNLPITCTNNMHLFGTLSGNTVYLKGNSSGSGTLDNLVVSGGGTQNLSGTINTTNITYTNTGIANQTGTINVSGSVQNTSSKVTNGQNTVLKSTGSIIGNHYNSGLTIDGITLDRAMTFGGTLKTINTVNLDDVSITGDLIQSSGTLNLNGDVTVTADSYFGGTVTQNENTYYSGGDITVNSTNTFNIIITQGKLQQNITGTLNTTNFTNTNPKGVEVSNTVNVSGTLTNTYGKISGMGMTLLSGGKFGSNTYQGDVTIQSTCDLPSKLTGDVVISATNTIKQDTDIGGYLLVTKGVLEFIGAELNVEKYLSASNNSLMLNNSALNVSEYLTVSNGSLKLSVSELNSQGKLTLSVPLTADEKSLVVCNSVFENNNTMTGNSTTVNVKDMVQNKGTINNCLVTVKEFINLGTVSGGSVFAISGIYNGNKMTVDDVILNPFPLAEISGNDITTKRLSLNGSGKISLRTNINVTAGYTNDGVNIDDSKIILSPDRVITTDKTYSTLNQIADLIIDGATVTVDTLTTTAGIKLTNGAKLIINKTLTSSGRSHAIMVNGTSSLIIKGEANIAADLIIDGSTVTVDALSTTAGIELSNGATMSVNKKSNAGASSKQVKIDDASVLTIKKIASISSYSDIIVNGELTLGSDAIINSTKLSGTGTINIKGDLYGNSFTINKPQNVNIIGKTPQIISCSGANFNNLNISNTSRKGVTFSSSVNCYGEYNKKNSNVSGTVTQK